MVTDKAQFRGRLLLFLIGVFSMTQIDLGGKIGISEFFMLIASPFVFFKDIRVYRKDGVFLFFQLIILWFLGAVVSDALNHQYLQLSLRGISFALTTFACVVCLYRLLRKDIHGFNWILFGIAVSSIVSIFIFQRGRAGDLAADGDISGAIDRVVGYKLFWGGQIKTWLLLPVQCAYLGTPLLYSLLTILFCACYQLFTGGRSNFMIMIFSFCLVLLGGRKSISMKKIKRYFIIILPILAVIAIAGKGVYEYAATHGYMGEYEQGKYEKQTKEGGNLIRLLVSGRSEVFISAFAALQKPIIGYGSHALDYNGMYIDFLRKYGSEDDLIFALRQMRLRGDMVTSIPHHSHLFTFWMWHGIFGLLYWVYVLFLAFSTLRKRMGLVPELYGYLAVTLPMFFWDVFFSPYGLRVNEGLMVAVFLLLKKIDNDRKRMGVLR